MNGLRTVIFLAGGLTLAGCDAGGPSYSSYGDGYAGGYYGPPGYAQPGYRSYGYQPGYVTPYAYGPGYGRDWHDQDRRWEHGGGRPPNQPPPMAVQPRTPPPMAAPPPAAARPPPSQGQKQIDQLGFRPSR